MRINIYTDGGCSGNPGPGGWAFVILTEGGAGPGGAFLGGGPTGDNGLSPFWGGAGPEGGIPGGTIPGGIIPIEKNGGEPATTNNRMELTAVIKALETLPSLGGPIDGVTVFTDSQYVQKGISEWIAGWKSKGWITSAKQPVKNADLWNTLDALAAGYPIRWRWVKGHAGNPLNERCDTLVQQAIRAVRAGDRAEGRV